MVLKTPHQIVDAEAVHVAERTAQEGREADAEDGADVAVPGRGHHAAIQGHGCFVEHQQHAALGDLLPGKLGLGLDAQHVVDARVHRLLALLAGELVARGRLAIEIEALAVLAPLAIVLQQLVKGLGRLELLATQLFFEDGGDLGSHVDPHLVQQGDGADRETEVEQSAVQYLHRLPFQHQARRLVHVGRQDAVDVEARLVLHHDGGLALGPGEGQGGGHRLGTGAGVGNDLGQRHLVHRAEVVQPHHPLRMRRRRGDLVDGQGGGVGSKHGVLPALALHVLHHLVLEVDVLEHRFHHHVHPVETGIVQGAGEQAHLFLQLAAQQLATLEFPGEEVVAVTHGIADAGARHILDPHRYPRLGGGDEGNTPPHQAAPQHGGMTHLARLGPLIAHLFLHLRGGEEEGAQGGRFRRHHQLAEVAGFGQQAGLHPLLHADAHHLDDALRRRVVAPGLGLDPLAGLIEQHLATKFVGLQHLALQIPFQVVARLALLGKLDGSFQQNGRGHHVIHQPELPGLFGPHLLAGQHQIQCLGHPDEARQALGTAGARQQAELHFRQAQHGFTVIGHHPAMTGERQLQPAAKAGAVNGGDHRDPQGFDLGEHVLSGPGQRFGILGAGAGRQHGDVGPGNEGVLLARDDHQTDQIPVPLYLGQQSADLVRKGGLQGVHALTGHIHGEDADAVFANIQRKSLGTHHSTSSTMATPSPPAAQAVLSPNPPPRRRSSCRVWVIMRAPVAAKG